LQQSVFVAVSVKFIIL